MQCLFLSMKWEVDNYAPLYYMPTADFIQRPKTNTLNYVLPNLLSLLAFNDFARHSPFNLIDVMLTT